MPTFVLSGLSKVAALPQMKAAWIACFAEGAVQAEALQRLEVISDTFLSMSAPIQRAIPRWLSGRATMQQQIRQRVQTNLAVVDEVLLGQTLMSRLDLEAGWYSVLRVPGLKPEEETALDLLLQHAVVVHPGGFFGFVGQGWLVVSLLAREEAVRTGVEALSKHFKGHS